MKYRIYYIVLFLLINSVLFSQEEEKNTKPGKPNDLDKLYTPDKNSASPSNGSSSSGSTYGEKKNFVKFNFALLARSTCGFFYERKITDWFSVQGGLGFCFGKDYAQYLATEGEIFTLSPSNSKISLEKIQNNGTFLSGVTNNPFLSGAVRFSFDGLYSSWYGNDDRKSYLELSVRYYKHHYSLTTLPYNNPGDKIIGGEDLSVKNTCYMLTWGSQIETDSKLVTSHEFYVGAGIRRSTYNIFTSTDPYNSFSSSNTTYTNTLMEETIATPMFTIGYVLGFGF